MADEQLRGSEQYLDEVEPSPPRWRGIVAVVWCLLLPAAVIIGAKLFLFNDMSTTDFVIRSTFVGIVVLALWLTFFRRRLRVDQ